MLAEAPWTTGRLAPQGKKYAVLFGRMYEDPQIEARVFPTGSRVCCIASAGCTAIHLAAGREVTAIDINPGQLAYAQARAAGGGRREGVTEGRMAAARRFLPLLGWGPERVADFLELDDCEQQLKAWNQLDTWRFRAVLKVLLSQLALRRGYHSALVGVLPANFGTVVQARLRRGWARHPNWNNPYAHALLQGTGSVPVPRAGDRPIRFVCADVAAFLEQCPPASFDGFALSNVLDGATAAYRARLAAAVRHAGAKGSQWVRRSFAEPTNPAAPNFAAEDRALLWGVVEVLPTGA